MSDLDAFTRRRLVKFIEDFRSKSGELPTLRDFYAAGFNPELLKNAKKQNVISEFYVTLTNGTIVKGYKLVQE